MKTNYSTAVPKDVRSTRIILRLSLSTLLPFLASCTCPRGHQEFGRNDPIKNPPSGDYFVSQPPVLVPLNFLSGEKWKWKVLNRKLLESMLATPMPRPASIPKEWTIFQVIENVTDKKFIWVPAPTQEDETVAARLLYREGYQKEFEGHTVGKALHSLLTFSSEFGFHKGKSAKDDEQNINVAIITEHYIIMLAVPTE